MPSLRVTVSLFTVLIVAIIPTIIKATKTINERVAVNVQNKSSDILGNNGRDYNTSYRKMGEKPEMKMYRQITTQE